MPRDSRAKHGRQPACIPCRRRKSRCHKETGSEACIVCRAHNTECFFPGDSRDDGTSRRSRHRSQPAQSAGRTSRVPTTADIPASGHGETQAHAPHPLEPQLEESPLTLASRDDQRLSLHIIGPAVHLDSQVLAEYLSGFPGGKRSARMIVPVPAAHSRPVLFTTIDKRPFGVPERRSVSAEKLAVIEQILEPYTADVVDTYFTKSNSSFPLLDEVSFRRQYRENKDHISPALLACLYANALIYWRHSPVLSRARCPGSRFVWNLANEALYSELYLSPGLSVISAILLNVGGRPNTSLIGNGAMLGSAVSMAQSLGLNRSPLHWEIPQSEKCLRMKIWWALLVHDRWTSLAHGTPPNISRPHHDVPQPTIDYLVDRPASHVQIRTASVYVALLGLTDVLDQYLHHMYTVWGKEKSSIESLEASIEQWIDSLAGDIRRIILRGTYLETPGAANLRLAYLTTRLLQQRIELEAEKQQEDFDGQRSTNLYTQARRTAEEILMFTQELHQEQLGDFWLPVTAFAFPSTVNFLLRCALETETSSHGVTQSHFFQIACDLMDALRNFQERFGWDLGDVCLAQHTEIVEKILAGGGGREEDQQNGHVNFADFAMPDASIMDQFFPSIWDSLQNAW